MDLKLGFLSVRQHTEHGFFGGYLLLNHLARPLEFHCTLPVKPTRAQALLYGHTLNDFVCGEQIARALVQKAKVKPSVIFTDSHPVLALQQISSESVFFLRTDRGVGGQEASALIQPASKLPLAPLQADPRLQMLDDESKRKGGAEKILSQLRDDFDMEEPFQRIVEALLEAHPIARAA
ncbi:MAG: hypothetical protein AAF394_05925 [Planctomycetota bacterium]